MNKWIKKIQNAMKMNQNTDQTPDVATDAEVFDINLEAMHNIPDENTTENTGETAPENNTPEISEADQLRIDVAQANDRYARLFSEFDNYKRRSSRERIDLITTAAKETIVEMLPVLDDFERSIQATQTSTDVQAVREGIELVYQKFKNILTNKGLEPIEALNQPFDVSLHEAITQVPATDESKKNTVFAEVEKGYKLNDNVVRYTKVVVAV